MKEINLQTQADIYNAFKGEDIEIRELAKRVFKTRSAFTSILEFEPRSGKARTQGLVELLEKAAQEEIETAGKDFVYRIAYYVLPSLKALLSEQKSEIHRRHEMLTLASVRETDSRSIRWLGQKPGRNIREKIAGSRKLLAVKRFSNFDIPENRLLKVFTKRLYKLLKLRSSALVIQRKEAEDVLLSALFGKKAETAEYFDSLVNTIADWLDSEIAEGIGEWHHLPPNNTLLQGKYYRNIWNGWKQLQSIDTIALRDTKNNEQNALQIKFLTIASCLYKTGLVRFVQQPVKFNYDEFYVEFMNTIGKGDKPNLSLRGYYFPPQGKRQPIWCDLNNGKIEVTINGESKNIFNKVTPQDEILSRLHIKNTKAMLLHDNKNTIPCDIATIDTCSLRPAFSWELRTTKGTDVLPFRLLLQHWNFAGETIRIDCGKANAIKIAKDIQSISMRDLFDENVKNSDNFETAGYMFINSLKQYLRTDRLIYLVPDEVASDFSLITIRKNINLFFLKAEPLPRSIACVFSWQATDEFIGMVKSGILKHGSIIEIIDKSGDVPCTTRLEAIRYSENLSMVEDKVPEMMGICWKRHISKSGVNTELKDYAMNGINKIASSTGSKVDTKEIYRLFGQNGLSAENDSLSIVDGENNWIHIPTNIKSIVGTRGSKQLNAGNAVKQLVIGEFSEEYSAAELTKGAIIFNEWQTRIPRIALWSDILPSLAIEGGLVDNKYGLPTNFILVDEAENQTILARRGEKQKVEIKESLFTLPKGKPEYNFPLVLQKNSKEIKSKFAAYLRSPAFPLKSPVKGKMELYYIFGADIPYQLYFVPDNQNTAGFDKVEVEWKEINQQVKSKRIYNDLPVPIFPENKNWQDFAKKNEKGGTLFTWITDSLSYFNKIDINNLVAYHFEEKRRDGKNTPYWEYTDGRSPRSTKLFLYDIRYPVFEIWNNGRSLEQWPEEFKDYRDTVYASIERATRLLCLEGFSDALPGLWKELCHFLCCLHKDMSLEIGNWVVTWYDDINILLTDDYYKFPAYAMGSCTEDWQHGIFNKTIELLKSEENQIVRLGFQILSVALWRSENIIDFLTSEDVKIIISKITLAFNDHFSVLSDPNGEGKGRRIQDVTNYAELLMAVLRLRNTKNNEIREMLNPDNMKMLSKTVERLIKTIVETRLQIKSRLPILDLEKKIPKGYTERKDNLKMLYGLYTLLVGDDVKIVVEKFSDEAF